MDLPFYFNYPPWPHCYPVQRRNSRFPSVSRGRIFEDPHAAADHARTSTRTRNRAPSHGSNGGSSSGGLPHHGRRHSPRPSHPQPGTARQAMQASPGPASRHPSPALWPSTYDSNARPALSFVRAARDLHDTLDSALDYFRPFYDEFDAEIASVKRYADKTAMDSIWVARIKANYVKKDENQNNNDGGSDEPTVDEERAARAKPPAFYDHQRAVYHRCEDLLHAQPVEWTPGTEEDVQAAALMQKLARCREDLFPSLDSMGRHYRVVGTALKEMDLLWQYLDTYREVWDGADASGSGNDNSTGGSGQGRRRHGRN